MKFAIVASWLMITTGVGVAVGRGVGVTVATLSTTVTLTVSVTGGWSVTRAPVARTSHARWSPFGTFWNVTTGLAVWTIVGSFSGIGRPLPRIGAGSRSRKMWTWTSSGRRARAAGTIVYPAVSQRTTTVEPTIVWPFDGLTIRA